MIDIETMAILIVDDMKSMRSIIKKMLRNLKLGSAIYFAENGMEGLRCLQANRVDLAIIDWKMPVMTGAMMLDAIRSDRQLRDLPVIMVTAESQKDIVLEVAEIEVEGYLLKPLTNCLKYGSEQIPQNRFIHTGICSRIKRKCSTDFSVGRFATAVI
jgi:CheY-like chemotaxis protein